MLGIWYTCFSIVLDLTAKLFHNDVLVNCYEVAYVYSAHNYESFCTESSEIHCVKSVRIRSSSSSHFSRIFLHSHWIRRDTSYLFVFRLNAGKCRKNADQHTSDYGHFLGSDGDSSFNMLSIACTFVPLLILALIKISDLAT